MSGFQNDRLRDPKVASKELYEAIQEKDVEKLKVLLASDCMNVNYAYSDYHPLSEAYDTGNSEIINLILNHHTFDPNARDGFKRSVLMFTHYDGYSDIFRKLLEIEELDLNQKDECGMTLLHYLTEARTWGAEHKLLLKRPTLDVNSRIGDAYSSSAKDIGMTPLILACSKGCWKAAKRLLEHPKIKVNLIHPPRFNAMKHIVSHGNLRMLEILMCHPDTEVLDEGLSKWYPPQKGHPRNVELCNQLEDRFKGNPKEVRKELRIKHGFAEKDAASMFRELVAFDHKSQGTPRNPGMRKFMYVFGKLPTELKMRVCNLNYGVNADFVTLE